MNTTNNTKRNLWPFAIIAFLTCFMVFSAALVAFASHQRMDLVKGDYYDEEIRYQEQLNRMNNTQAFTNQIKIGYDAIKSSIEICFPQAVQHGKATGYVRLYRPSDDSLDKEIELAVSENSVQSIDAKAMKPGLWRIKAYWSIEGTDYYYNHDVVLPVSQKP